ncbi:exoribonuclease R [Saccharopolyspora lacisalsi]|uniref:Exoribonuclease R n=1 Tax=Halosaccharopolyspora lacisalsi TaxID=1000566 RepID=A0A839DXU0_9PSEU|nr:RNB domain-containing ribonuclease [Halosaccharopolyspora lacisalsi]MBA8825549.1 exoribonuclease R [Halosaccharopolyspora lacisalsi]
MAAACGPQDGAGAVAVGQGAGPDFSAVRAELGLPGEFSFASLSEAERVVVDPAFTDVRVDATDLAMVTVDPPGSKDLDQAVLLERRGRRGYRIHYAIADVAAFVPPGGALDVETHRRGQTLYLPDGTVPLHPTLLSEGAASLLPEQTRPAVLWRLDLDGDGVPVRVDVRRAWVRSVAQLDYEGLQRSLALGTPSPAVALLPEVGELRREQAVRRGAIELGLPEQQVNPDGDEGWSLTLRPRLRLEAYNAEISLMTGMCAAEMMCSSGIGVLRTVPDPEPGTIEVLRRSAARLGLDWPSSVGPAEFLAGIDPARPDALALHVAAIRLLRGAGYTSFEDGAPGKTRHAGIGAAYAHVTAPLRRLVDRYGAEVCLAVDAGRDVPEWVSTALPQLPSVMGGSDRVATQVERACIAQAQSWTLTGHIGEEYVATVLRAEGDGGEVFVADPPVIAPCRGDGLEEGRRVRVRLFEADPVRRAVAFEVVAPTPL